MRDRREVTIDRYVEGVRYNVYACESGHHNLSMDVDEGVTPMFLTCRVDGCGARSSSMMYPKGEPPTHLFPVRIIWRRATNGELKRERREGGEHYRLGGLALEWASSREGDARDE